MSLFLSFREILLAGLAQQREARKKGHKSNLGNAHDHEISWQV